MRKRFWFGAAVLFAVLNWAPIPFVGAQGNPTCPTRPPGDSSNACASTAFVHSLISGAVISVFGRTGAVIALAGDYAAFYLPLPGYTKTVIWASDLGVVADGVTDVSTQVNNVLTACRNGTVNATYTGCEIYWPAGVIYVASTQFTSNFAATMTGVGQGAKSPTYDTTSATNISATKFKSDLSSGVLFTFNTKNPVIIRDLWLQFPPSGTTTVTGIRITNTDPALPGNNTVNFNSRISNVTITGSGTGISTLNAGVFTFFNNYIQDYRVVGIDCANDSTNPDSGDATISGNHFQSFYTVSGIGIQLSQMGGMAIGPNNKILGGTVGVQINASVAGQIGGENNIHDNNIEAQAVNSIRVTQTAAASQTGGVNIIDNHINSGTGAVLFQAAIVFVTSGTGTNYVKRGKIHGNDILYTHASAGASAIDMEAGENIEIHGNTFGIPSDNHTISINSEAVNIYYHNNGPITGPAASGLFGTINAGNNLIIDYNGATFANIPTSAVANGSVIYVTDGAATSGVNYLLVNAGNGMIANRIRGAWYATQPFNP